MSLSPDLRQRLLLVLVLLFCFFNLATALNLQFGFPLDDSYIHQTVARNLATYGTPGLVPGQRSSGSTSAIWPYIQAAKYKFFSQTDPVTYNAWLSLLLLLAITQWLYTMAERDGLPPPLRFLVAVAPAFCGNFLWLGFIGMEHLLFVALSMAAILAWCALPARSSWALLAGFVAGTVALTRPEGIIFFPFLLLTARRVGRTWKQAAIAGAAWLPLVALLLASNYRTSHALLPSTYGGRAWLNFHDHGGPHSLWAFKNLLGSWALRPARMLDANFSLLTPGANAAYIAFLLLSIAMLALLVLGVVTLVRLHSTRLIVLCAWCLLHMLTYEISFPNSGHGGRYQPLWLILIFPLVALGVLRALRWIAPSENWPLYATAAVLLAASTTSLFSWRTVLLDGIAHINNTDGRMAEWTNDHLPGDAKIASFDIGRISYDRATDPVVDLGGLADHSYLPYLMAGNIAPYLSQQRVQYVMVPSGMLPLFGLDSPRLTGQPLVTFCSPQQVWRLGYENTHHAQICQTMFRFLPVELSER
jgi:hypothetical protein